VNRRRLLGLGAALGATAAAAAACGVPSDSAPQRVGEAPSSGPTPDSPPTPPVPDAALNPADLVQNYFKAAAWANIGGDQSALTKAQARAREYLYSGISAGWQPTPQLTVGRAVTGQTRQDSRGYTLVDVLWTSLGKLNDRGAIEPDQAPPKLLTFAVIALGATYRLADPPPLPGLVLSDTGLTDFYQRRQIYFWDQSEPTVASLVPDVRYLPRSITEPKRPAEIIRWLSAGPADWLQAAAQTLPEFEPKDASVDGQDRLVVNLSSKAATLDKAALRQLAIQLRWSVDPDRDVQLRIEGTPAEAPTDGYLLANGAIRNDGDEQPERFGIVNHKVCVLQASSTAQILDSPENTDAISAAIPLLKRSIALVRREAKNSTKQRLWIGTLTGSGDSQGPVYRRTNLLGERMSRPVWLRRPSPQAIVACDGRLFTVAPPPAGSTAEVRATLLDPLPAGVPGPVTAVAVSPDGHRLALVAAGRVLVVPLVFGPQLDIGPGFLMVKTEIVGARAVGWTDDTRLYIGGPPASGVHSGLAEVGVDGTGHAWVPTTDDRNLTVDMLSMYPVNPRRSLSVASAMFEAGGVAWVVFSSSIGKQEANNPSPSPSPSANQPGQVVSAPFFLD
jgi:hypothetical protein